MKWYQVLFLFNYQIYYKIIHLEEESSLFYLKH